MKYWCIALSLFCIAFFWGSQEAYATHNRAGEIIYTHISGLTYEIRIITITKTSSSADRPYLKIRWGDEPNLLPDSELDSLPRVIENIIPGTDAKRNEYVGQHTYSGPGVFELLVEDPNRNSGVVNIVNSVNAIFSIRSVLVISPDTGHNNSVRLLRPALAQACIYQPWIHNPAAFDPDGDELVYSLVSCLGENGDPLLEWTFPSFATTNDPTDIFAINPQTGDLTWTVPPMAGEFNVAILIEEFRNGVFVGSVLRDMQIDIIMCSNQPPVIAPIDNYCVMAGESIQFNVQASDPDFDNISLSAYGGPLSEVVNEAEWNDNTGFFRWSPECEEVRAAPYNMTFEATDDGYVNLSDITTISITVVAPRVENPTATALGNSISLTWEANTCGTVVPSYQQDEIIYQIYRRQGLYNFDPDDCELGVPSYTGYVYLGEVAGWTNTSYTDNTVFYGGNYCYMIVTIFPDGAVSYASEEVCAEIKKDVAVMTKVSIGITDVSLGVDTIWWSPPSDLDTLVYTGPFQYKLYRGTGFTAPDQQVYESNLSPFLIWSDTTFVDENLNTLETGYTYRVDFFSNGQLVTSSSTASSVFVLANPIDNAIALDIRHEVPWTNIQYDIFRKAPGETDFSFIGTSDTAAYTDSNLENNELYCYKVFVTGTYNADNVPDPLFNWSQEVCAQPYDQTPPCAPSITAISDCETGEATLTWNNPNNSCADDVQSYNIWRAPTPDDVPVMIASINSPVDTVYLLSIIPADSSIAGCYYITALDSLNLWPDGSFNQNESELSNAVCIDNCPVYTLPDVFTPNNDGSNDVYIPFPYRYVKDIELKVFNRWGTLVFETTDRDIQWNGTIAESGEVASDGVYYYTITVNTIRLSGIAPINFSGYFHIIDGGAPVSNQ